MLSGVEAVQHLHVFGAAQQHLGLRANGLRQELRVGLSPVVAAPLIDSLIANFERASPTVSVELIELNLRDLEQALANGSVDVAIAPLSGRSAFKSFVLYTEPLLVVGAEPRAGERATPLCVAALADVSIIMMPDACGLSQATVRLFREARLPLRRAKTTALGYGLLERAALRGRGRAILPLSKISAPSCAQTLVRADGSPVFLEVHVLQRRAGVTRPQQRLAALLRAVSIEENRARLTLRNDRTSPRS